MAANEPELNGVPADHEPGWLAHLSRPVVTWTVAALAIVLGYFLITTPLSLEGQTFLAVACIVLALIVRRDQRHLASLILIGLSLLSSSRYMYWRITETLGVGDPGVTIFDLFFTFGLLAAELYALFVMVMGYFQTLQPLSRKPSELPDDRDMWPTVDLLIPTFNEPLEVVQPTIMAALDVDWPPDKLNIYVLDDGDRHDFRELAETLGVGYIAREGSEHAKAGNINYALAHTDGELVAMFDADHIPTRSFLQVTVGVFLEDPRIALVQTPHHFFSPDPFERNLKTFRKVPNEGELFYRLIQDGNDFWNATFFCGSCAIMRRAALDEIGGVAVETVTEDAHTALKLHRRGWHSAYYNVPQAAGLATESISGHVGQRIRWARGMAQIFRIDNPLLGRGLSIAQRLCYLNAMSHFFYALPRIVFLTAPLGYLLFEVHIFQAWAFMIAAYAVPHLFLAWMTTSRLQGPFRHSFWAEVYETVLAPYIWRPTWLAVINPKLGKFNVTTKGGLIRDEYLDLTTAKPYLILFTINVIGLGFGAVRLIHWNSFEWPTVVLNLVWAIYNTLLLGVAIAVTRERQQLRRTTRVAVQMPVYMRLPSRRLVQAETIDLSEGGVAIRHAGRSDLNPGDEVWVALLPEHEEVYVPSKVISADDGFVRLEFEDMDLQQRRHVIYCLYGRADAWLDWAAARDRDRPWHAFKEILKYGLGGIFLLGGELRRRARRRLARGRRAAPAAASLAAVLLLGALSGGPAQAQGDDEVRPVEPRERLYTLGELGVSEPIRLNGVNTTREVGFAVRADEVVTDATLNLRLAHSDSLIYDLSQFHVYVNGELIHSVNLGPETAEGIDRSIDIDPRLLVDYNRLTFEFLGHYTEECEDLFHNTLWALVSDRSTLKLDTRPLPLADDLSMLPRPFFDRRDAGHLLLPFVFAQPPDAAMLEAAGTVASWFGGLAAYRGADFPVSIGHLPQGNAVVFTRGEAPFDGVSLPEGGGARIAIRSNPVNPRAKLLVIVGADAQALQAAARALVLGSESLVGANAYIDQLREPDPREPYDAPRWLSSDEPVALGDLVSEETLQVDGYLPDPIRIPLMTPPDLFTWRSENIPLDLRYRFTQIANAKGESTLNISFNGGFMRALPAHYDPIWPVQLFRRWFPAVRHDELREKVMLPAREAGGPDNLSMQFHFEPVSTDCRRVIQNVEAAVSPQSTIDISHLPHYTRMPALGHFVNAGFPFTRLADLSDTAVVMPSDWSPPAVEAYLTLMGAFGNFTGYPAIRLQVVRPDLVEQVAGKNLLVLGSADTQPLLSEWGEHMPLSMSEDGRVELRTLGLIDRLTAAVMFDDSAEQARRHAGNVIARSEGAVSALIGFESPLDSGRSVVALAAHSGEKLSELAHKVLDPAQRAQIEGDLALFSGNDVSAYRIGDDYHVGDLPLLNWLHWTLSKHPVFLFIVMVLLVVLVAMTVRQFARSGRTRRLSGR